MGERGKRDRTDVQARAGVESDPAAGGRAADPEKYRRLDQVLAHYKGKPGVLIEVLREAQLIFGRLPREVQVYVANALTIPAAEVYSVVSFYSYFSQEPFGRHHIELCMGTACYVNGAEDLLEACKEELKIEPGEVTSDGAFSLGTSHCVGSCSAAPVMLIGSDLHGRLQPRDLPRLLERYRQAPETDPGPADTPGYPIVVTGDRRAPIHRHERQEPLPQ